MHSMRNTTQKDEHKIHLVRSIFQPFARRETLQRLDLAAVANKVSPKGPEVSAVWPWCQWNAVPDVNFRLHLYPLIWVGGSLLLHEVRIRLSCNANLADLKKYYFALRSGQRQLWVLEGPASDIFLILTRSDSFLQL
jgi:hypothetical protein